MFPVPYSIYIHVPFCRQACSYCDFYFITRQELIPAYTEALIRDIRSSADTFVDGLTLQPMCSESAAKKSRNPSTQKVRERRPHPSDQQLENTPVSHTPEAQLSKPYLSSVYFGGGTPSRLPARTIERILETIHRHHGLDSVQEITMEANPDDLTSLQAVRDLKNAGVTRLSMGVQSFNPDLLQFMNRAHSARQAEQSLDFIQQADFKTYTVDLIYGNPGQTLRQLETDIKTFLSWNPPHISAYALTIEPGTRLGKALQLGRLTEPDDHEVARHMQLTVNLLADAGLHRYEVSNFALPGHEAVHNSSYWNHTSYLGIGPGAHGLQLRSTPDGRLTGALRWSNPADVRAYIQMHKEKTSTRREFTHGTETEILSPTQLAEERLLMGLRTSDGVQTGELLERYGYQLSEKQLRYLEKMRSEGYFHPLSDTKFTTREAEQRLPATEGGLAEVEQRLGEVADNPSEVKQDPESSQLLRLTDAGLALADRLTLELLS